MVTNYVNPYINPYGQTYQPYQQQLQQQQQVVKVNGENGARAYQMGANSSALLLDECGTIVWLATTDGASYKTVTPYDITPHKVATANDFSVLESRISRLEELVNATVTNDTSTIKRKPNGKSISTDNSADQAS